MLDVRIPEAKYPIETKRFGINYPGKSEEPNDNSGHKKTRELAGPVDYLCLLEITLVYKPIIPFWGVKSITYQRRCAVGFQIIFNKLQYFFITTECLC